MYETYEKKSGQGRDGSKGGWGGDNGTRQHYADKAANTRDDHSKVTHGLPSGPKGKPKG